MITNQPTQQIFLDVGASQTGSWLACTQPGFVNLHNYSKTSQPFYILLYGKIYVKWGNVKFESPAKVC